MDATAPLNKLFFDELGQIQSIEHLELSKNIINLNINFVNNLKNLQKLICYKLKTEKFVFDSLYKLLSSSKKLKEFTYEKDIFHLKIARQLYGSSIEFTIGKKYLKNIGKKYLKIGKRTDKNFDDFIDFFKDFNYEIYII